MITKITKKKKIFAQIPAFEDICVEFCGICF